MYFLFKFRSVSEEELEDALSRVNQFADEAADALRQVAAERGMPLPAALAPSSETPIELTAEERMRRTDAATALWNGSTSKHVQYMFSAQALVFSFALLGPQGLRSGALWLLILASLLGWIANRLGRQYTRKVCADADRSIADKQQSLKATAIALWGALILTSFVGVALASALRGA